MQQQDGLHFKLNHPPPPWTGLILAAVVALPTVAVAIYLSMHQQPLPPLSSLLIPVIVVAIPIGNVAIALVRRRTSPGDLVIGDAGVRFPAFGGAPAVSMAPRDIRLAFVHKRGLIVASETEVRLVANKCFADGSSADDALRAVLLILDEETRADVMRRSDGSRLLQSKRPWAVYAVGAVVALVFALEILLGRSPDGIVELGAAQRDLVVAGAVWRLCTATLMHGNVMHIALNGVALFSVGPVLERWLGWRRFVVILFGSALLGAVASVAARDGATVGLSGGIFGLLGALLLSSVRYRKAPMNGPRLPVRSWAVLLVANTVVSLMPGVDGVAHGAGLVVGAALCALMAPRLRWVADVSTWQQVPGLVGKRAVLAAAITLLVAYGASVVVMVVRALL